MVRLIFLIHRYLGIAIGLIISIWCLSGFVMMYVQYPALTDEERLPGLAELDLAACCRWPADFGDVEIDRFRVEMLDQSPVLRLLTFHGQYVIDLERGQFVDAIPASTAHSIAAGASKRFGLGGHIEYLGTLERDQWTVYGSYNPHRPLFHYSASDAPGTELYVSSRTGEVVQMTTAGERFWNWLGAVPHWFYPTMLRQHTYAWSQVVIWMTVLGLFLTVLGLYIGIRQYRVRRNGRRSPYRGAALWHHYAGLLFGVLTLTWLLSGLFSMTPWGLFQGRSFTAEQARLQGTGLSYSQAQDAIGRLRAGTGLPTLPAGTVRLEGAILHGGLYYLVWDTGGERLRLDARSLATSPLPEGSFADAAAIMRPGAPVREQGWMSDEDAYYFNHHEARRFPVYRIHYEDGERVYLDGVSGALAYAVDSPRRGSRWWFHALHRGDFSAWVRNRPVWDLLMLTLMAGVTVGVLTGTWMGFRRLTRSARKPLDELAFADSARVRDNRLRWRFGPAE